MARIKDLFLTSMGGRTLIKTKSIAKSFAFLSIYSVLNLLIPIITAPYVSRILEADGIGKVAYAQNIVTYFILLASLGIPNYAVREIAKVQLDKKLRDKTFFEIFIVNLIATVISSVLYYGCIYTFDYFATNRALYSIVGISLALNVFNIDWFYTGTEDFKFITIRGILIKLISVFCIFIFVHKKEDFYIYTLILTLATSFNYVINIIHLRKLVSRPTEQLEFKHHLRPITVLLFTALAVNLYTLLDTTMIGYLCDDVYVGYYSNAMKLSKLMAVAIASIGTVLLPRISLYYHQNQTSELSRLASKAISFIVFVSVPCAVGMTLISDDFVFLMFGPTFGPAGLTMKILSWLVPILSIGNIFATPIMMATGNEKRLMYTVFLGAGVNIVLNAFLIPIYQQNGAAIASVAAEFVVMVAQIIMTRNIVKINISKHFMFSTMIQILAMVISIELVLMVDVNQYIRAVSEVVVGVVIYTGVGLLIRNEIELEVIRKILKRKAY